MHLNQIIHNKMSLIIFLVYKLYLTNIRGSVEQDMLQLNLFLL